MKHAVVFIIWLFILMMQGCTDSPSTVDQRADDDNAESSADIDIIVLKGSSSDGGNAIVVDWAFTAIGRDSFITWRDFTFRIEGAYLPFSPDCDSQIGERLQSDTGNFSVNLLSEKRTVVQTWVPKAQAICSVEYGLNASQTALRAEGELVDGRQLILETSFDGVLPFYPIADDFYWNDSSPTSLLAVLNLGGFFSDDEISKFEVDAEGIIPIDSNHNSQYLVGFRQKVLSRFGLYVDLDHNYQADPQETTDANQFGRGIRDDEPLSDGDLDLENDRSELDIEEDITELPDGDDEPDTLIDGDLDVEDGDPPDEDGDLESEIDQESESELEPIDGDLDIVDSDLIEDEQEFEEVLTCQDVCAEPACGTIDECDCGTCTGCASECVGNTCESLSMTESACFNGDIYWYDSCGNRESLKEACSACGCSNAVCVVEDAYFSPSADSLVLQDVAATTNLVMEIQSSTSGSPYIAIRFCKQDGSDILADAFYLNLDYAGAVSSVAYEGEIVVTLGSCTNWTILPEAPLAGMTEDDTVYFENLRVVSSADCEPYWESDCSDFVSTNCDAQGNAGVCWYTTGGAQTLPMTRTCKGL